jgi:Helix-turn-helix of DDE superfamily endonuclease
MKTPPTDIDALPRRYRRLVALTGLTASQVHTVYVAAHPVLLPDRPGRVGGLPPAVRVLLVLVHLRTNLTTRALAVLVATSQSATDPIIGHLVPTLATALRPQPAAHANTPWMIDVVPPKSWRVSYAASGLVLDSLIS